MNYELHLKYLWSTGDTISPIIVSPVKTTTYSLIGTKDGCSVMVEWVVTVNTCVGIDENLTGGKNLSGFRVYPNPIKDEIFVYYNNHEQTEAKIEIYNIIGELQITVNLKGKNIPTKISVSNLVSGVYFYRIKKKDQVVLKDKLVIIR